MFNPEDMVNQHSQDYFCSMHNAWAGCFDFRTLFDFNNHFYYCRLKNYGSRQLYQVPRRHASVQLPVNGKAPYKQCDQRSMVVWSQSFYNLPRFISTILFRIGQRYKSLYFWWMHLISVPLPCKDLIPSFRRWTDLYSEIAQWAEGLIWDPGFKILTSISVILHVWGPITSMGSQLLYPLQNKAQGQEVY